MTFDSNVLNAKKTLKNILFSNLNNCEFFFIIDEKNVDVLKLVKGILKRIKNANLLIIDEKKPKFISNSEYVIFLNSNQYVLFDRLKLAFYEAKKTKSDIYLCNFEIYNLKSNKVEFNYLKNFEGLLCFQNKVQVDEKKFFSMPKFVSNIYKSSYLKKLDVTIPNISYGSFLNFYFEVMFSTRNIGFFEKNILYQYEEYEENWQEIIFKQDNILSSYYSLQYFINEINKIMFLFKKKDLFNIYIFELLNYIFNLLRFIYRNFEIENEDFNILQNFIRNIHDTYHNSCVVNLNYLNITFYRDFLNSTNIEEMNSKEKHSR